MKGDPLGGPILDRIWVQILTGISTDPERLPKAPLRRNGRLCPRAFMQGLRPLPGYVSAPDGTESRQGPKVVLMMRQTPKGLSPVAYVCSGLGPPEGPPQAAFGAKARPKPGLLRGYSLSLNEVDYMPDISIRDDKTKWSHGCATQTLPNQSV